MRSDVLVVIPARNEVKNLESVIGELRRLRPNDDVLVVDDRSNDGTGDLARRLGCAVLSLPLHLGYGGAVQAGIKYGLRRGYPLLVTFDGDGQHDPADIGPLVEAGQRGGDLVLGSRFLAPGSYRGGLLRRTGRRLFAAAARALAGVEIADPTSGLKALGPRAQALFATALFPDRFPDADALVLARRADLRLEQRPARMRPSRNPHSMHDGHRAIVYTLNMLLSLLVAAAGRDTDLRG